MFSFVAGACGVFRADSKAWSSKQGLRVPPATCGQLLEGQREVLVLEVI